MNTTKGKEWEKIATHDDKNIKGFFGPYSFLSNFYKCNVTYDGRDFPSSEHAYMFAKLDPNSMTFDDLDRIHSKIIQLSCADVKKWGRTIVLRSDWDLVKFPIMNKILWAKFRNNNDLRKLLLDTGAKYLEETNWWGDTIWGVDIEKGGNNNLGKALMKVREALKLQGDQNEKI